MNAGRHGLIPSAAAESLKNRTKLGKPSVNTHRQLTRHEAAILGAPTSWHVAVDQQKTPFLLQSTATRWTKTEDERWQEVILPPTQAAKMVARLEEFWARDEKQKGVYVRPGPGVRTPQSSNNPGAEEIKRLRDALRAVVMSTDVSPAIRRMICDVLEG